MIKKIWSLWKDLAKRIGDFQIRVVFSILYFVLIFPVGFVTNLFKDYLKVKKFPEWERHDLNSNTIKELKEQ